MVMRTRTSFGGRDLSFPLEVVDVPLILAGEDFERGFSIDIPGFT